MYPALLS